MIVRWRRLCSWICLVLTLLAATADADTIFVSDPNRQAIWKIDGNGTPLLFLQVRAAQGLAFDASGNLFAAVASPPSILKIDSTGQASVFANSGLQFPTGIAFDRHGALYVSDCSAQAIIRYDQTGLGSVFASGLHGPIGLAFDRDGNLFVADQSDNTIVKIRPDGSASVFANSRMEHPYALAFDRLGRLYVSDGNGLDDLSNDHIARFERDGSASVFAAGIIIGRGLAFDGRGFLYALDFSYTPLMRFDGNGNRVNVVTDQTFNQAAAPTFLAVKPELATPQITATEMANGAPRITFLSSQTSGYALQRCGDLTSANWNSVTGAEDIFGTGGPVAIDDTDAANGTARFYRVITTP